MKGRRPICAPRGIAAILLPLIVVAAGVCGCSGGGGEPAVTGSERERSRACWEESKSASYQYRLEVGCFCPPSVTRPVGVTVTEGVRTAITPLTSGVEPDVAHLSRYDTIEKLFDLIADAENRQAETLRVTYDPATGYPTDIFIDYRKQIADEEISLRVSGLTPPP